MARFSGAKTFLLPFCSPSFAFFLFEGWPHAINHGPESMSESVGKKKEAKGALKPLDRSSCLGN
jgi:hypothetical protein